MPNQVEIKVQENFPHLINAPIAEAAFEIKADKTTEWDESAILEHLKQALQDYPKRDPLRGFTYHAELNPMNQLQPATQEYKDLGWTGYEMRSENKLQVARFNRDGFLFSRLNPYESWEGFHSEALRLWHLHKELSQPSEIQRIGLRFINRIRFPKSGAHLKDYLLMSPRTPENLDLPIENYLHMSRFSVPGHAYEINLIQTVQPHETTESPYIWLLVDIDVYTSQPCETKDEMIELRLGEMRWLKNKVFFGSVTPKALEEFGGERV